MTQPFKASPRRALKGAALASELRQTYPLSVRDEHALRAAVESILVEKLVRASVPDGAGHDLDVRQAATALGMTTTDLRRKLAHHGLDTNHDRRRTRMLTKKTGSKTKRVSPRASRARAGRASSSVRG